MVGKIDELLKSRINQARAIINHRVAKDAVGIQVIPASVFRCFLSVLEKDAEPCRNDLEATRVWNDYLLAASMQEQRDRARRPEDT